VNTLKIACEGAGLLPYTAITPFQGELKSLSKDNFKKMKAQLERGYSFPIAVWRSEGKNYILDGHQRLRTIEKMAKQGWVIPDLPVTFTEADSYAEAKSKCLAAASQFGVVESQGLYEFIQDAGLDVDELLELTRFPEIDFYNFKQNYFDEIVASESSENIQTSIEGSKELTSDMFENFAHQCPKCGFEFNGKK